MITDQQLDAVVRAGLFRDRNHAVEEAMRTRFTVRPQLKTEAAVELFRSGEVSLLRAAESAGLDFASFQSVLRDCAISREIETDTPADMNRAIAAFFGEPQA